jgi:SulP family sulfate permease
MGLCRLGSLIKYIPYPLVTGFTTGIALVLFSSQIKDFFGLQIATVPADFIEKWSAYFKAFSTWDPLTFALGFGTLALIILIRRFVPVVPWGITSIVIITSVTIAFDLPVETIASRFGELPRSLPLPSFPHFSFNMELLQRLIPDAITIALLAGIESLLSAVISDRMIGGRHKSNCELVAQGAANFGSILFGGIPATAAIARTAINAKTGAKTPIAGIIHAATLFLIIFLFAPLVSQIPLATLAAVLMTVAWNMSEWEQFRHLFKAPAGDIAILLTAFLLTVLVDLTVAVEAGMILAVFLFMKRMSEHSGVVPASVKFNEEEEEFFEGSGIDAISKIQVPQGVHIFEIDGPFFFGVADRLKEVAFQPESTGAIFILRMRKVPLIDASGMYALKEFYLKCQKEGTLLILSGVREVPAKNLKKFGLHSLIGEENIFPHLKPALKRAHEILKT